jgi:hypothetical protein
MWRFCEFAPQYRAIHAHGQSLASSKLMFRIHEFSSAAGALESVYLRTVEEGLEIVSNDGAWRLPQGALHAVLARFGAPFAAEAQISSVATLHLPDGESLRHVRHLAGYDVIGRDYLVYERPNDESLCALAATVAAALLHLGRAAQSPNHDPGPASCPSERKSGSE